MRNNESRRSHCVESFWQQRFSGRLQLSDSSLDDSVSDIESESENENERNEDPEVKLSRSLSSLSSLSDFASSPAESLEPYFSNSAEMEEEMVSHQDEEAMLAEEKEILEFGQSEHKGKCYTPEEVRKMEKKMGRSYDPKPKPKPKIYQLDQLLSDAEEIVDSLIRLEEQLESEQSPEKQGELRRRIDKLQMKQGRKYRRIEMFSQWFERRTAAINEILEIVRHNEEHPMTPLPQQRSGEAASELEDKPLENSALVDDHSALKLGSSLAAPVPPIGKSERSVPEGRQRSSAALSHDSLWKRDQSGSVSLAVKESRPKSRSSEPDQNFFKS